MVEHLFRKQEVKGSTPFGGFMKYAVMIALAFLAGCASQYEITATTSTITTITSTTTTSTTTILPAREKIFKELNFSECNKVSQLVIERLNITQPMECWADEGIINNETIIYVTLSSGGCPSITNQSTLICPPVLSFDVVIYNDSILELRHTLFLTEKEKITVNWFDRSYDITLNKVLGADSAIISIQEETGNITKGEVISLAGLKVYAKGVFFYGSTRTDNQMILRMVITPEFLAD